MLGTRLPPAFFICGDAISRGSLEYLEREMGVKYGSPGVQANFVNASRRSAINLVCHSVKLSGD